MQVATSSGKIIQYNIILTIFNRGKEELFLFLYTSTTILEVRVISDKIVSFSAMQRMDSSSGISPMPSIESSKESPEFFDIH